MSEKTFLVEIGTEELPPKALRSLAESFAANFTAELDNAGLAHGTVQWFAAPRRLALKVANLAEAQPDREIEKRGPAIAQAFDAEGKPSKAAEGWARGCGITVDQAERLTTDKGEWLLYRAHVKGESTEALLPNMVATSLAKLPIPKLMRWGASDVHFVRPVHTVTLLLGDKVIPATILGIQSDRVWNSTVCRRGRLSSRRFLRSVLKKNSASARRGRTTFSLPEIICCGSFDSMLATKIKFGSSLPSFAYTGKYFWSPFMV